MIQASSARYRIGTAGIPHHSWGIVSACALLATGTLAAAVWIAAHVSASPAVHTGGLFIHLVSLVIGFGGVLMADSYVLRWAAGRLTLTETLRTVSTLHVPIWLGLAGLVASGCVLEPNLASTMTRTKLALVLVLTLNGIQAGALNRRLRACGDTALTPRLLAWGAATGLVSQICWWGATVIGFINAQP
ncbi:hypothetical protein NS506_02857 [Nocardia seriolae]|uniref:DUF2214 domain-containing protein n=1 Tax=Nocardia seriolae TaxID=37332 RepID=A0ABC8AS04_9NOCA|nr:hypothetical protein [Nocardia seriolae]APA96917.1 hypothetical protein NS506_02857 [Nocardia seriolae]BEK97718.1 hypothetical protein NSER024013_56240 [Nocardia seriolae]GEM22812.1 hypothetical protein NS2_10510 [Nocardia seriolae NBRC 15557]